MASMKRLYRQRIFVFFGGFLALLPNGITWLWGNLSVYVLSYFHAKHHRDSDSHEIHAPWLISIYISLWILTMIVASHVDRLLGRRKTIALGMFVFNTGVVTTYFVFDVSIYLMNLTLGFFGGIGNGLVHGMAMQCVVEWAKDSQIGLATSGVVSGYALGAIITNQFVTHYVNPDNLKPNLLVGRTRYFTQKDILDRVPCVFLFYTAGSVLLGFVGLCLMRKRPPDHPGDQNANFSGEDSEERRKLLNHNEDLEPASNGSIYGTHTTTTATRISDGLINAELSEVIEFEDNEDSSISKPPSSSEDDLTKSQTSDPNYVQPDGNTAHDLSPRQMFKTKSFYSLWFSLLLAQTAYTVLLNYYKTFGQEWIKDDHFLTDLGTASSCFVLVARPLWGLALDRIALKTVIVWFLSAVCLVSTFYYFMPQINRWLYFVWTLMFVCLGCGVLTNFSVAVVKLFGKKNFVVNNAIVFTSAVMSSLLAPPVIQAVVSDYGWFQLFFGVAVLNFIGLLLVVTLLSDP